MLISSFVRTNNTVQAPTFSPRCNASALSHKTPQRLGDPKEKSEYLMLWPQAASLSHAASLRPSRLTGKLTLSRQLTKICKPYPTYSTGARVNNGFAALCCHKHFRLAWRSPTKKPWKRVTSFKSRKTGKTSPLRVLPFETRFSQLETPFSRPTERSEGTPARRPRRGEQSE
jgi:hypothetical protein